MDNYIAHANIDHYLEILGQDDISPAKRAMVIKLLIEEVNKLSRDLEQLQFAETKLVASRNRVEQLERLRAGFVEGSADRMKIDRMLLACQGILTEWEGFCHKMRKQVEAGGL